MVEMLADQGPVARHAAAALQNLAIEPEHCTRLVAAGFMKPLLQLLHAPDDHEALLAAAAGALSNLAYEDKCCNKIATAAGCVARLVQLLSHSSCVVREAAASVLGKLAWEPELCEPIAGKQQLTGLASCFLTLRFASLTDAQPFSARHVDLWMVVICWLAASQQCNCDLQSPACLLTWLVPSHQVICLNLPRFPP
jgi:hypothetical protein